MNAAPRESPALIVKRPYSLRESPDRTDDLPQFAVSIVIHHSRAVVGLDPWTAFIRSACKSRLRNAFG